MSIFSTLVHWQKLPSGQLLKEQGQSASLIDNTVNGQIALHKVFGGARDTDDFLVLTEAFPQKSALCLDGRTCRGAHNLCGSSEGLAEALDKLPFAAGCFPRPGRLPNAGGRSTVAGAFG